MSETVKNTEQTKPVRSKTPRRSSTALLVILCLLLAGVAIVLSYMLKNHVEAKSGSREQLRLSAIAGFDCEYTEAQQLYPFKNGLLKVTSNRIAYLSISGNDIYGVDVEMSNPVCKICGDYAMVADTDGFLCAVFNEDGKIFEKHLPGKIGNLAIAPSGISALIMDEGKSFGEVYIMNNDGSFLAQWSSNESGYPVSLEFSPDEKILSVSLVDTDGSQMAPNIKQFSIPTDRVNQKPSEYAVYSPQVSDIMPLIAYLRNDLLAVAGINDVAIVGEGKCTMVDPPFACVSSIFSYDGGYAVIYSDGLEQPLKLAIYDSNAGKRGVIDLGNQVQNYHVSGNRALIAVDENIYVINLSNGKIDSKIPVDETVIRVSFFGSKNICVITSVGVREISI